MSKQLATPVSILCVYHYYPAPSPARNWDRIQSCKDYNSITTSQHWRILDTLWFSTFHLQISHMCTNPLLLRFLKGEAYARHQNVTVYVGIYVSINDPQLSFTLTLPPPCLTLGMKQLPWYALPACFDACCTLSGAIIVGNGSSNPCSWNACLQHTAQAFLCISFSRGFLLGGGPCSDGLDAVWGVWSVRWQVDLPLLQPLQQCW